MNEFIAKWSYLAIFLLIVGTGIGLPIPEEVPIVAAGVLSSPNQARMDPWLAFAVCIFGALIGDSLMYLAGRTLGRSRLRNHRWFARLINAEREKQMEQLIEDHGLKVFMAARFLVGIRGPMYVAAGMTGVSYRRFITADATCGFIVVGFFFWASFYFGGWIEPLIRESQLAATIVFLVFVVGTGVYCLFLKRFKKRLGAVSDQDDPSAATKQVTQPAADVEANIAAP